MGFDSGDDFGGSISQINVTPLVDVMLVLLIIFMVAAPILQQGVELELPKADLAPLSADSEQLVVSIKKNGSVFIGAENEVPMQGIGERLSAILEARDDKRVYIKADKSVVYGEVMTLMSKLRQSGISKVGLVTDPDV